MSERAKIAEQHRRRRAVVYVRQSTLAQVASNVESAARQYALVERAVELGWPREAVAVVDGDTGRSGSSSEGRVGFNELAASVGLGEIGLILALEVSRLARSSADWHRLLDLCALTGTLIADQDGVYLPSDFNDRLLLGLKGTMSEVELHLIRARLDGGLRNKAERGELALSLPVGLDRDEQGRVVLSTDEQVRATIAHVFSLWERLGSARQVVAELIAAGERLPRRTVGERRVRWARPSYGAVHDFLTNPAYAGAFVFGKTRREKRLDGDGRVTVKTVELPREQWAVCLPEHHPGYVSWHDYLATRERLRKNARPRGEGGGAAREGAALLQGLLRCGRCGRRMQVAYSGTGGRSPRYACVRGRDLHATGRACQSLGGRRLDHAVATAFLEAVSPAGVAAAAGAVATLEREHQERLDQQRLALERAEYEAERSRRQYDACEPEHRLVARTLERTWEEALAEAEHEHGKLAALERTRPAPLTDAERIALRRLARDLPGLWAAETTHDRERKELLRTLVREVVVRLPAPPHERRDDRTRAPARGSPPRSPDRRDPEQAGAAQRHRPALHRGARPRTPPARRDRGRPAARPRKRTRHTRRGGSPARRLNGDDPPLAQGRPATGRTGDTARTLADPPQRRTPPALSARGARRLPAARRGRQAARCRPPDRFAPGPTRRAASDPGYARKTERASDRGFAAGGWTVCNRVS